MRFVVLRCEAEWKILTTRRRLGHFQTFEAAFSTASALALEAKEAGHEVELLVQGLAGDLTPAIPIATANGQLAANDLATPDAEPVVAAARAPRLDQVVSFTPALVEAPAISSPALDAVAVFNPDPAG